MNITQLVEADEQTPWEFTAENRCKECRSTWRITEDDRRAPFWRSFLGILPEPRAEVLGPGFINRCMYYVKFYANESGVGGGTALVSRCPGCGEYCMTWKERQG